MKAGRGRPRNEARLFAQRPEAGDNGPGCYIPSQERIKTGGCALDFHYTASTLDFHYTASEKEVGGAWVLRLYGARRSAADCAICNH